MRCLLPCPSSKQTCCSVLRGMHIHLAGGRLTLNLQPSTCLPSVPGCSHLRGMYIHVVYDAMNAGFSSQYNTNGMIGALRLYCPVHCPVLPCAVPCHRSLACPPSLVCTHWSSRLSTAEHTALALPPCLCSELPWQGDSGQLHFAAGQAVQRAGHPKGTALGCLPAVRSSVCVNCGWTATSGCTVVAQSCQRAACGQKLHPVPLCCMTGPDALSIRRCASHGRPGGLASVL